MKKNIPFSLPLINQNVFNEVFDTLKNTGWLTSGPKVKEFEHELSKISNCKNTVCVNSWTSGAMLILKWYGIGQGDEVIIPSYTYSATALAVLNIGAIPIMIDVANDFNIDTTLIKQKINNKTKAIMPVDLGGLPCDYHEIMQIICEPEVRNIFNPQNERQYKLGRILLLSDSAHSIGSIYKGKPTPQSTDFSIYSFHSVKNITTGEGGAITLNLPAPFNNDEEYKFLKSFSLNGQTKSAFEKNQPGNWRYDIIDQGLKANMPDICAAIGLAQIKDYSDLLLPERKKIFNLYNKCFSGHKWAITPLGENEIKESSYHLYLLRIDDFSEIQRDKAIIEISSLGIGVNVHYVPMATLTLFKNLGYNINDYPNTINLYKNVISLPIYNGLKPEDVKFISKAIIKIIETNFK